jgi:hypothetical protein
MHTKTRRIVIVESTTFGGLSRSRWTATFVSTLLTAALLAFGGRPASAAQGMHEPLVAPKCAAGDTVVGINMMTKRYMTQRQMKTKTAGMSDAQILTMMMKHHISMMCMSKAKAMGGTLMEK